MSHTITVVTEKVLSQQEVIAGVHPELVTRQDPINSWPTDSVLHCYIAGRSARAVEVGRATDGYTVRIMSCSARTEYDLALDLVERLASLTGGSIQDEASDEAYPVAELRTVLDTGWIDGMLESGPRVLQAMIERAPLTLTGAVRAYVFGERVAARLEQAGPPDEFGSRLIADIVRVQNLDLGDLWEANVMKVSHDSFTVAVVKQDGVFLPMADRYAFGGDGKVTMVAAEHLELVLGEHVHYVDQAQAIVWPLSEADWTTITARASEWAISD